jgi:hypothetical protein
LNFTCSLDGCTLMYSSKVAYWKHSSRAHSSHWNLSLKNDLINVEQV